MTNFQSDIFVGTTGFDGLGWWFAAVVAAALVGLILSFTVDENFFAVPVLAVFTLIGLTVYGSIQDFNQVSQMGETLQEVLVDSGYTEAFDVSIYSPTTGDGTKFKYVEDNEIKDCTLVASSVKGEFKVVCF